MSGHSDFGIFTSDGESSILNWVSADAASGARPAEPGSLDIFSMTYAAFV